MVVGRGHVGPLFLLTHFYGLVRSCGILLSEEGTYFNSSYREERERERERERENYKK